MVSNLEAYVARYALTRIAKQPVQAILGRRFSGWASRKLVIYYEPDEISFTQIYPFLFYASTLKKRYSVQIRCRSVKSLLAGHPPIKDDADIVLLQAWFTVPPEALKRAFELAREANPNASISFLDGFAHNDVRLSCHFVDGIDFYLKKSLFKDRDAFFKVFRGGTNLTEYYGEVFNIPADPIDWRTPREIIPKLRLSPNFFTSPKYLNDFSRGRELLQNDRPIDIQTRFGVRGSNWYAAMRTTALEKVKTIPNVVLSANDSLSWQKYMEELQKSKLCLSPFGYGELCWRDVEAILAGSVLIKPDMGHLDTYPNIYQPCVTYLPVKWDFSDLEDVVQYALSNEELRMKLTQNAYRLVVDYVQKAGFVDDVEFLFNRVSK